MVVLGGNAFVRTGQPLTMGGQFEFARDLSGDQIAERDRYEPDPHHLTDVTVRRQFRRRRQADR